jgi:hypothetical protein
MTQYKSIASTRPRRCSRCTALTKQTGRYRGLNSVVAKRLPSSRNFPPTEIAMEACGGSHYWARELSALGHRVLLIPSQYVKPFVKRGKNDRIDARPAPAKAGAICEACPCEGARGVSHL